VVAAGLSSIIPEAVVGLEGLALAPDSTSQAARLFFIDVVGPEPGVVTKINPDSRRSKHG
jgi:hypothetical protein